jgi:hypothetical protein
MIFESPNNASPRTITKPAFLIAAISAALLVAFNYEDIDDQDTIYMIVQT